MALYNKYDKTTLKKKLMNETFKRTTLSFYRYVLIERVKELRDVLYEGFENLGVLGRIYIAREGINAQISVPETNWDAFLNYLQGYKEFADMPIKIAVEDDGKSFYKLTLKVKPKIVVDGLSEDDYDITNVGNHLTAKEFNKAMDTPGTVVVDIRNYYESEIGHFEGAICPQVDTFREELPEVLNLLRDKKDEKILLYCTGGIRCEKASAFLRHHGFKDINQLYGGIIDYTRQVTAQGLDNKFVGKNFVFDERLGERISKDVIAQCHQCGKPADTHTNCANDECHLLFIQCDECREKYNGCCTSECQEIAKLPLEVQRERRKGRKKEFRNVHKSRIRPSLLDISAGGEMLGSD